MTMRRRDFLHRTGLGGLSLTLLPGLGGAQQVAAARRFRVGSWTVTALGDGFLPLGADVLQGIDQEGFDTLLREAFVSGEAVPASVNAYLIDTGEAVHMIDAGTGAAMGDSLGRLTANLEAAGRSADEVDTLLMTHLHIDHIGGVTSAEGKLFPNASLALAEEEFAFWHDSANRDAAPEQIRGMFDAATSAVAKFGDAVTTFTGDVGVAPGVTALALPGHTPGHTGYLVENEGEGLLLWGDITHVTPVQFARPEVTIAFDTVPDQARETRMRMLDRVVADRQLIAGAHLPFPGVGHVERAGDAYRYVPLPFDYL